MTIYRTSPQITNIRISGNTAEFDLSLSVDLLYFQGHFAYAGILPGVVQIHWAVLWGQDLLGVSGQFRGMDHVKFHRPAKPGDTLAVNLTWVPERAHLSFRYSLAGNIVSSGHIRLR